MFSQHQENSLYFFVFLEFIYLILVLASLFFKSKPLVWSAYILAGLKYSISAITSIDIISYNIFYAELGNFDNDISSGMEIGFVALLYLAKSLNLPIVVVHFFSVVFFLFAVKRLLAYFLPQDEANILTLVFGFFPIGGELCIYLLRQLISTAMVVLGLSLSLNNKKLIGFAIFLASLLFHISSVLYSPFFIVTFIKNRFWKTSTLIVLYLGVVLFFFLPPDLIIASSSFIGESQYVDKYEKYTTSFDERNEVKFGIFNMIILGYLFWCIGKSYKKAKDNKIFSFCCCSLLIVIVYLACEANNAIWMSSRIKCISTMLIISSSIILTAKFVIKGKPQVCFSYALFFVFFFSVYFINLGHSLHNLYQLPII